MNKEFIPYDRALRMKAIGFDEPCFAFYYDKTRFLSLGENPKYLTDQRKASYIFGNEKHGVTLALTFSQAFRFFREKYGLHSMVSFDKLIEEDNDVELDYPYFTYYYSINELWDSTKDYDRFVRGFINVASSRDIMSHEEAELACLDKLLEIVESKSE